MTDHQTNKKTELQINEMAAARLQEKAATQRVLDRALMNSRMEDSRMGRCLALVKREADLELAFQQRTDHAEVVNARTEKEVKLGLEIAKVRDEETCKLLRRHFLWERDPELRELMQGLKAGYTCRDLKQQILHNEYKRLQEKTEDMRANEILNESLYNEKEARERDELAKLEKCGLYRQELQQQLVSRRTQRQCEYEDTLIEKKMFDELLRTIADEDDRERKQKREMNERMRHEMKTFQRARDAWRDQRKTLVIMEEKEIERQRLLIADRNSAIIEARKQKLREHEALSARIAAKVLADEAEKKKRADILRQLQEQEFIEQQLQNDIAQQEKAESSKRAAQRVIADSMAERSHSDDNKEEIDEGIRRRMAAELAALDAKELAKQQKQKEKNKTYAQELLKQIAENEQRKKKERQDDYNRAQTVIQRQKKWDEEIAEERKKIIREHVPQLLGYLRAGVLENSDLPAVREGANKNPTLAGLDIEGMGKTGKRYFPKCNEQCVRLRQY